VIRAHVGRELRIDRSDNVRSVTANGGDVDHAVAELDEGAADNEREREAQSI
jgi:hypothetical protein